jgi:hypothetical protein
MFRLIEALEIIAILAVLGWILYLLWKIMKSVFDRPVIDEKMFDKNETTSPSKAKKESGK